MHAVRISNEDESVTNATLLAFPDLRMEATDDTVVTFYEAETADSRRFINGSIPDISAEWNSATQRSCRWNSLLKRRLL